MIGSSANDCGIKSALSEPVKCGLFSARTSTTFSCKNIAVRTITFILLSIVATSLGACASVEEDEAVLRSWIGSSDKEVWARFGKPNRVIDDQGWRQWYYEFSKQTTTTTPMSNGRGGTWMMPITVTHTCSFGFILDPKNNVADVGVKKIGCEKSLLARSSKDVPPNALIKALTGKSE